MGLAEEIRDYIKSKGLDYVYDKVKNKLRQKKFETFCDELPGIIENKVLFPMQSTEYFTELQKFYICNKVIIRYLLSYLAISEETVSGLTDKFIKEFIKEYSHYGKYKVQLKKILNKSADIIKLELKNSGLLSNDKNIELEKVNNILPALIKKYNKESQNKKIILIKNSLLNNGFDFDLINEVLKKINKGLILTIIVLAALLIYISGVEKQRNADKPDIRKACEDFILLTDKYVVLPEDMQKSEVSEEKVNEYVNQMKSDVEKVMISNTEAVKIQKQVIENNLRNGYDALDVRIKMSRKIKKINGYEFDGNQVTVKLKDQVEIVTKVFDEIDSTKETETFDASNDEIILQKIDGKWKIVYSNLQFDGSNRYYSDDIIF